MFGARAMRYRLTPRIKRASARRLSLTQWYKQLAADDGADDLVAFLLEGGGNFILRLVAGR